MSKEEVVYQVTEIYSTISGEAPTVGTPATFIRLYHCPVRCQTCDTLYSVFRPTKTYETGYKDYVDDKGVRAGMLDNTEYQRGYVAALIDLAAYVETVAPHELVLECDSYADQSITTRALDHWHIPFIRQDNGVTKIGEPHFQQVLDVFQPRRNHLGRVNARHYPESMTVEQIVEHVVDPLVVITGGEPLIHNLDELLNTLDIKGFKTQVETSGAYAWKGLVRPDITVVSPKPNVRYRVDPSVVESATIYKVVNGPPGSGFEFDPALITRLKLNDKPIYLMPWGSPPSEVAETDTKVKALKYSLFMSPRLHYTLGLR